jgi:glycerophosphoryl diester phosphodiesterase
MNRRQAIKLIGGAGAFSLLPQPLFAKHFVAAEHSLLPEGKFVVGHRGASAYAPENTLASYALCIKQGAEYVEQDLQITRDGVLVCCHDSVLERISNVEEVFPDRFVEKVIKGKKVKQWPVNNFTLKEIKQLDAGSSFDPKFKGEKIPTWQEAIELIKGKAGLCPETKGPETYEKLGFDMEALFIEVLKKNGLEKPRRKNSTPILIQSFSVAGLKKLVDKYETKWPVLRLSGTGVKWTPATLDETKPYASVIGPYKGDVTKMLVDQAHERGMKVVPFTFFAGDLKEFSSVKEEMHHYLYDLGVDGMFTNNPDQFPREV